MCHSKPRAVLRSALIQLRSSMTQLIANRSDSGSAHTRTVTPPLRTGSAPPAGPPPHYNAEDVWWSQRRVKRAGPWNLKWQRTQTLNPVRVSVILLFPLRQRGKRVNTEAHYLAGRRSRKPRCLHSPGSLFSKREKGGTRRWKNFWLQCKPAQQPASRAPPWRSTRPVRGLQNKGPFYSCWQ